MTFEQWRATRKDFDALPENDAGVYAGLPGSVYEAGFILATGDMSQCIAFTVPLPQNEHGFSTLAEAEEFLWREWCRDEVSGVDISGGRA